MSGPINVKWFGARGDGIADDTAALQSAIDHCARDDAEGPTLYLPAGSYRTTAPLVIPRQYFQMQGDGMWKSRILFGASAGGLVVAPIPYVRPVLRDFALMGDERSGTGVDFTPIQLEVYLGELRNLYVEAGDDGLRAYRFFSMVVDTVSVRSYRGHCFRVQCGPAVSWRNCYAVATGAGKAGYRLSGTIALYSCNGVNNGDYWGVFGCDREATDGFQGDFPESNHASVTMIECNVEEFASGGRSEQASAIVIHNYYRHFNMIGGKLDRFNLSTPYHSIIRSRKGPNAPGSPIRLSPGFIFPGPGVPTGGHLYSDGRSYFSDETGSLVGNGIVNWKERGRTYPLISSKAVHDAFGRASMHYTGLSSDAMAVGALHFNQVRQPSGQAHLVTSGRSAVVVRNEKPTTVATIRHAVAAEGDARLARSSLVIVQVEDDVTTFRHLHDGEDGLRLEARQDYRARKGDVLMFLRSNFFDGRRRGWVQV